MVIPTEQREIALRLDPAAGQAQQELFDACQVAALVKAAGRTRAWSLSDGGRASCESEHRCLRL